MKSKRVECSNVSEILPFKVLYDSEDYVVINKPPDVRMDGDANCTIEKALSQSYVGQNFKWVNSYRLVFLNCIFIIG